MRYKRVLIHNAVNRAGARGYFASANGKDGFFSLYGEIYNEKKLKNLYILKGGPGTGKSTLLDKIANKASSLKLTGEVFLCSSDSSSLDGVVIDELGVAVIDGTAPHAQEPLYPGVCGEIVNLGENWNSALLKDMRGEIESLFIEKSAAYSRAYRYLSGVGIADDDITIGIRGAVDTDKMNASVERMLNKFVKRCSADGCLQRRFITANATAGAVAVDTLDRMAVRTVTVNYSYGVGRMYMDAVKNEGVRRGLSMTVAPNAISPEHTDAVFFHDSALLVILTDGDRYELGDVCVNSKRFVNNEALSSVRMKLRFSEKAKMLLHQEALRSLSEAGSIHSKIETLYKSAMDFDSVTETGEKLIKKIFS